MDSLQEVSINPAVPSTELIFVLPPLSANLGMNEVIPKYMDVSENKNFTGCSPSITKPPYITMIREQTSATTPNCV